MSAQYHNGTSASEVHNSLDARFRYIVPKRSAICVSVVQIRNAHKKKLCNTNEVLLEPKILVIRKINS